MGDTDLFPELASLFLHTAPADCHLPERPLHQRKRGNLWGRLPRGKQQVWHNLTPFAVLLADFSASDADREQRYYWAEARTL